MAIDKRCRRVCGPRNFGEVDDVDSAILHTSQKPPGVMGDGASYLPRRQAVAAPNSLTAGGKTLRQGRRDPQLVSVAGQATLQRLSSNQASATTATARLLGNLEARLVAWPAAHLIQMSSVAPTTGLCLLRSVAHQRRGYFTNRPAHPARRERE